MSGSRFVQTSLPEQRGITVRHKPGKLKLSLVLASAVALSLAGCGSGGSDNPAQALQASPDTFIEGTAAYGAALANASITVKPASGTSACMNDPVTTNATGAYSCKLDTSAAGPFAIVASDPDGLVSPIISILASAPAAGARSTANVTPLTTAIAAQRDTANKDPFALEKTPALLASVNGATLNAIKANVVTQLAAVLTDAGVDAATFDPTSTPFVGGNRAGVDKMLEQVRVSYDNGIPSLSNVLDPIAAPIPLADASTATPEALKKLSPGTAFSPAELDFSKIQLEACFAVPSAQRATLDGSGAVTATSSACQGIFVDDAGLAAVSFVHNGKGARAYLKDLLVSADMDGARFNLPELLRFNSKPDGKDEAVVNLKYLDRNGIAGNLITVMKKYAGTDTNGRGSAWWLYGNQRPIDAFVRAAIRQREQMIPATVLALPAFDDTARSRYETGLEVYVGRDATQPAGVATGIRYVRVKGPGLPDAGLVYADVSPLLPQTWLGIHNASGTIPAGAQQLAPNSSNIFRLQRTQGISGTPAFTIRPNPGVGAASSDATWAHPDMYGAEARNPTWKFDLSKVPSWSQYAFEVFRTNDGPTAPSTTFTASIVTTAVPATYAATQHWHSFTAATRALVTDGAAASGSLAIAWDANALAERVRSVNAYSSAVNSPSTDVPKGVFSRLVDSSPATIQFPALSTANNVNSRVLQLRYNVMDGSYKDQLIQFN
jgi:hypothetical protein